MASHKSAATVSASLESTSSEDAAPGEQAIAQQERPLRPPPAPSIGDLFRPAAVLLGAFTVVLGALYPLLVTGLAQAAFPAQANGSMIAKGSGHVGSALIGQAFTDPGFFWGRPSATSPSGNNAEASTGSNLGPSSDDLRAAVIARIAALRAADPEGDPAAPVPVELVTASGSGVDPEISPAAAAFQVKRVARARNLPLSRVEDLVQRHTEGRWMGIVGEPRVNVLRLNLALAALPR